MEARREMPGLPRLGLLLTAAGAPPALVSLRMASRRQTARGSCPRHQDIPADCSLLLRPQPAGRASCRQIAPQSHPETRPAAQISARNGVFGGHELGKALSCEHGRFCRIHESFDPEGWFVTGSRNRFQLAKTASLQLLAGDRAQHIVSAVVAAVLQLGSFQLAPAPSDISDHKKSRAAGGVCLFWGEIRKLEAGGES